eukprot:5837353-Pyramimonas_sp.AAC.1
MSLYAGGQVHIGTFTPRGPIPRHQLKVPNPAGIGARRKQEKPEVHISWSPPGTRPRAAAPPSSAHTR